MTAPSSSDVTGDVTRYPVYELSVDWNDSGSHPHNVAVEIRYESAVSGAGGLTGSSSSVEDVETFLTAMATWASSYAPDSGTNEGSVLNKVVQTVTNLYDSAP